MSQELAIVLDTETTGLIAKTCRVTELAIVDFADDSLIFHTYFNPECPIPPEITTLTGITDETVAGAPLFRDRAPEIHDIITSASVVIGQNPGFDKGMIDEEMRRAGIDAIAWPTLICTRRIWDIYEPREERSLINVYKRFVNREGFVGAHGAIADTRACRAALMGEIIEFGLQNVDWNDLDPERKFWFGPSHHILWSPDRTYLICNFGKNRGVPVAQVDRGFWEWVKNRDFDDHVLMLAIKVIDFRGDAEQIHTWARGYQ